MLFIYFARACIFAVAACRGEKRRQCSSCFRRSFDRDCGEACADLSDLQMTRIIWKEIREKVSPSWF